MTEDVLVSWDEQGGHTYLAFSTPSNVKRSLRVLGRWAADDALPSFDERLAVRISRELMKLAQGQPATKEAGLVRKAPAMDAGDTEAQVRQRF